MPIFYLASRFVCNYVAQIYPAYASYKALRTRSPREIVPWLMYWIVLALFSALESVADVLVFWIPFYYECKAAFIIWLIVGKGHIFLYRHFVHPALRRHEDAIDAALLDAQLHAVQASSAWGKRGLKWVAEQVMQRWSDAPAVVAGAVLGASTSLSGVLRDASAKQDVKDEQQSAIPSREPRPPQDDRKTSTNRPQSFASRFHLTSQAAQPRARRRSSSTSKRPRSLSPAKSKTSSSPPPTLRPNAATTLPAGFHVDPSEWDDLLRTVSESNMAGDA